MSPPVEVNEFAARARAFVQWCESPHAGKSAGQMQFEALQQLAETYAAALRLPKVDFMPSPEPPSRDGAKTKKLAHHLQPLPFQYYREMFTPTDLNENGQGVDGDLLDDFLDIHGDLSQGLWLYERGHCEAAVFLWRFAFAAHWGRHAVSAMHALHSFDPEQASHPLQTSSPKKMRCATGA